MRIIRNDPFIKRRAKLARYFSLGSMGVLLLGLVISFSNNIELLPISFVALILGFIGSQVGIYLGNRYSRADRPDEVLAKSLKGFDDRYTLYQYTAPVGNLLLTPNACIVFVVKLQAGAIEFRNGKWRHHVKGLKRIFGFMTQETLGNPGQDADIEVSSLHRHLEKKLPGVEVPIQPVIVFGNPLADVDAGTSPVPALHAKKLKDWLRGAGRSGGLSADAHDQLVQLFEPKEA